MNNTGATGLSIVIPVYQAEGHITALVNGLLALPWQPVEIICVDDASTDGTWQILCQLKAKNAKLKPYRLAANVGQHRALLFGMRQAGLEYVLTLDDDMEGLLDELAGFVDKAAHMGMDVVYGRFSRSYDDLWRKTGSDVLTLLLSKMSPLVAGASQIRLIHRHILSQLAVQNGDQFVFLDCLIPQLAREIGFVDINFKAKRASRYSSKKLTSMALNIFLHYTHVFSILILVAGITMVITGLWLSIYPLYSGIVLVAFGPAVVRRWRAASHRTLNKLALTD